MKNIKKTILSFYIIILSMGLVGCYNNSEIVNDNVNSQEIIPSSPSDIQVDDSIDDSNNDDNLIIETTDSTTTDNEDSNFTYNESTVSNEKLTLLFASYKDDIFLLNDTVPLGLFRYNVCSEDVIGYYGYDFEYDSYSYLYPDILRDTDCISYATYDIEGVVGNLSFFFSDNILVGVGLIKDYNTINEKNGDDTDIMTLVEISTNKKRTINLSNGTGKITLIDNDIFYCCNKTSRRNGVSFTAIDNSFASNYDK